MRTPSSRRTAAMMPSCQRSVGPARRRSVDRGTCSRKRKQYPLPCSHLQQLKRAPNIWDSAPGRAAWWATVWWTCVRADPNDIRNDRQSVWSCCLRKRNTHSKSWAVWRTETRWRCVWREGRIGAPKVDHIWKRVQRSPQSPDGHQVVHVVWPCASIAASGLDDFQMTYSGWWLKMHVLMYWLICRSQQCCCTTDRMWVVAQRKCIYKVFQEMYLPTHAGNAHKQCQEKASGLEQVEVRHFCRHRPLPSNRIQCSRVADVSSSPCN